jgi:hypothetical protein
MCPRPQLSDASLEHVSHLLFVTRVIEKCHGYLLFVTRVIEKCHGYAFLSVTRPAKTRHMPYLWHVLLTSVTNTTIYLWRTLTIRVTFFYLWRVLLTRVMNTSLLVTRLAPGAWATTNRWRVSWTHVTDRLLVTRFVFVSRIVVSLITFSRIVVMATSWSLKYYYSLHPTKNIILGLE